MAPTPAFWRWDWTPPIYLNAAGQDSSHRFMLPESSTSADLAAKGRGWRHCTPSRIERGRVNRRTGTSRLGISGRTCGGLSSFRATSLSNPLLGRCTDQPGPVWYTQPEVLVHGIQGLRAGSSPSGGFALAYGCLSLDPVWILKQTSKRSDKTPSPHFSAPFLLHFCLTIQDRMEFMLLLLETLW